uniref:Uncharacterized protein n=1 Tax=Myripristis murdjan TaxID=586833 RepID=A0A667YII6_9TELE
MGLGVKFSTLAEVVTSISACPQFFLEETPPRIPGILEDGKILNQSRYKPICQTYNSERRFVTLYDISNKIPVFSAYNGGNINMVPFDDNIYMNQAGNNDYKKQSDFDRGHIFPNSHAFTVEDKNSTFTLTNVVPQAKRFNQQSWNKMESCVKCVLQKYCINNNARHEGFVVTGAQPSTNNFLNNKINIPSMLWSAFCCYSSSLNRWIASAHWGDNVPDEHTKKYLTTRTLEELHQTLIYFCVDECPLLKEYSFFFFFFGKIPFSCLLQTETRCWTPFSPLYVQWFTSYG